VATQSAPQAPWSIFTGPKKTAPLVYAEGVLHDAGAPETPANIQFVYDWERSEGGGGVDNPLNVGPVTGYGATSGSQYGGGAANYASLTDSAKAVAHELHTPTYAPILAGLKRSTYRASANALFNSPWAASHYGHGKSWATTPVPQADLTGLTWSEMSGLGAAYDYYKGTSHAGTKAASQGIFGPLISWVDSGAKKVALIIFGAVLIIAALVMLMHGFTNRAEDVPGAPPAPRPHRVEDAGEMAAGAAA
jgi:hypothetical protein